MTILYPKFWIHYTLLFIYFLEITAVPYLYPIFHKSQVVASGVISTTSIDLESHLKPVVSLLFLSILFASYYSISTDFIRRII